MKFIQLTKEGIWSTYTNFEVNPLIEVDMFKTLNYEKQLYSALLWSCKTL